MKKLFIAATMIALTLNLNAAAEESAPAPVTTPAEVAAAAPVATEPVEETGPRLVALRPYVGLISGVDIEFRSGMYFGLGTNFMKTENTDDPKYIVYDPAFGSGWWNYGEKIKTEAKEFFHASMGWSADKLAAGLHIAFGNVKTEGLDAENSVGFGIEAAWHVWDNLFVKGSVTYFTGTDMLGDYTFYDKGRVSGTTLYYKEGDKISVGSDWKFGLAIGYKFSL